MRNKTRKLYGKAGAGTPVKGLLLGSAVGAAVGWLTAPASREEIRRLIDHRKSAREKIKTSAHNIESQARALAEKRHRNAFPTAG